MQKVIILTLLSCLHSVLFGQDFYTAPETGQLLITACEGTVYDSGGAEGEYTDNNESYIIIEATEGDYISITFSQFDIENNWDFLTIYSGDISLGEVVGVYTGSNLPNDGAPIEIASNTVTIAFESDFIITGPGFAFDFECLTNDQPPVAAAAFPSFTCTGTVAFSDESTYFPNSWAWDFGDGSTSDEQNPTHTYAAAGDYTVSLTACNDNGCDTFTAQTPINYDPENELCNGGLLLPEYGSIETQACTGVLFDSGGPEGNYTEGNYGALLIAPPIAAGITITFTEFDLGTQGEHTDILYILDPETSLSIATYFGDELPNGGQPITFDLPSVWVVFTSDHTDNNSGFTMYWEGVGTAEPPVAAFSTENTTVPLYTPILFTDESQNFPGQWLWNFGDGTTSELQNPSHVFTTPGTYEVTLEVTNCNSSDAADPLLITVLPAPEVTINPAAFDVTLEAGTTLTQNLNICNVGEGPLLINVSHVGADGDLGYRFRFTTSENGAAFTWALAEIDGFDLNIIVENTQDYEANQTYTEQVTGLDDNTQYYLSLNAPEGGQALTEFLLLDPATDEVLYELPIESEPDLWFWLPAPMPGSFGSWLDLATTEVTIAPNQCLDIPVVFDATELFAGVYERTIAINTNDPNQLLSNIPVTMTVTGAPQIAVTPQTLDFGAITVGASSTLNFTITNEGTDELSLAGLTSAEPAFALSTVETLTLAPQTSQMVQVSFTPAAVTEYETVLSLENNAGDPVQIILLGSGTPAPSLTLSPDAFNIELIEGQDTTLVTNIGNVGEANLNYNIQSSSDGIGFLFEFTTDFWGEEFYWTLTNSQGEVVLSSAFEEYQGNTMYAVPLSGLSTTESYMLNLFDSFGDGALPAFTVADLSSGVTIIEGSFTAPDNPSELILELGSPNGNILTVDSMSGTVDVNDSQAISIGIETEGMATGTYQMEVLVATNDPVQPEATVDISLHVIAPVNTDFEASLTEVCGLIPVQFTDLTTNTATSWSWDFGDGTQSDVQNPSHLYTEDGAYTVTLISCNSLGCDTLTQENYISVETGCYAQNIPQGHQQETITVCEGNVYDSGGPNGIYLEGNGGRLYIAPPGATEVYITFSEFNYEEHADFLYVFDGPYGNADLIGVYTGNELEGVTLTASSGSLTLFEYTDHFNNLSGFVASFSCSDIPVAPIAGISFQGNDGVLCSNEPILFFDESTSEPDEWFWDFGDGGTSNEENPVHLYAESGTYPVQLTACNSIGCDTEVISIEVNVNPDCIIDSVPGGFLVQTSIAGCSGSLYDSGGPEAAHLEGVFSGLTLISISPNLAIAFTEFDMSEESMIYIYDGYDASAPLIGIYTGDELPEAGASIIATGNVLTIYEYTGDNPNGNSGFALDYFCADSFTNPSDGIRVANGEMCDGIMTFKTPDNMLVDSWTWDFGDGTTSSEAIVTHEFPHEGAFEVQLTACYQGECSDYFSGIYSNKITPEMSAPNLVTVGTEVDFHGLTENVTHWYWDFGNGESSEHNMPSTVYTTPGEYDVHVHMINMNVHETCDAEHTHRITIVNDETVSTEELEERAVRIFPNPANEVLNVDLGTMATKDVLIRIYSMEGQLIRQITDQTNVIPINDLAAGTYLVEVIQDELTPQRLPFIKVK